MQRAAEEVAEWVRRTGLPTIRVDGNRSAEENVGTVMRAFTDCYAGY